MFEMWFIIRGKELLGVGPWKVLLLGEAGEVEFYGCAKLARIDWQEASQPVFIGFQYPNCEVDVAIHSLPLADWDLF